MPGKRGPCESLLWPELWDISFSLRAFSRTSPFLCMSVHVCVHLGGATCAWVCRRHVCPPRAHVLGPRCLGRLISAAAFQVLLIQGDSDGSATH